MKSVFVSLASLLVTASAFAMPAVGDQALYNVNLTQGAQSMTGTLEQLITGMDGSLFVVQQTTNMGKDSQVQTDKKAAQDLLSDATVNMVLQNCAANGGKSETITVPAGTFPTCAIPVQDSEGTGTYWIGAVAFGIVKGDFKYSNGVHAVMDLQSFKMGQ